MLEGIISTNPELYAIKAVVRTAHPTNFNLASRLMAEQVALLYPSSNKDAGNKSKISAVEQHAPGGKMPGGQDGQHGGQPKGRTGGGGCRGNQQFLNGVDVSDLMQNFTSDEWKRLRESGFLSWIIDRRAGMNNRRAGGGGRGNNRGGRGGGNPGRGGGNQGRGVQVGAVTTNATEADTSTITDSANNATATRHAGSCAGLQFGGNRFRNGANASGGQS
jgi:hypothetical protein